MFKEPYINGDTLLKNLPVFSHHRVSPNRTSPKVRTTVNKQQVLLAARWRGEGFELGSVFGDGSA